MPIAPTHVHADAITLLVIGGAVLFWDAFYTALAAWWLARNPDSSMAMALAVLVGVGA